ncbi:hypothetical protein [Actinorhabdospora filicis]|uniref:hypothetical protein n=1 Tax=Actinorhabdospora filicis TaxID=1785913 RepID=UPI0025528B81|nr:hypothetical protein [Actinorhabdospora filicis]
MEPPALHHGRWLDAASRDTREYSWRTPIPWPCRVGVPPAEVRCHQHREATFALDEPRNRDRRYETTGPVHVLVGPSGVGKTQAASRYVRTLEKAGEIDLLIWVPGATREAVLSAYAEAADLVERGTSAIGDAEARAARFLSWARDTHKRWFIVLDDLADLDDLTDLGHLADPAELGGSGVPVDPLADLWPTGNPNGRVLVTARVAPPLPVGAHVIELGPFRPVESYEFLAASLLDEAELLDEYAELAADLGHHPLSLAQAAAYIRDQRVTCHDYRKLLAAATRERAAAGTVMGTTAGTVALCADLADEQVPDGVARMLRQLVAHLDGRGIPLAVFTQPVVLHHLGRAAGRPVSAEEVAGASGALDVLHRLGLITRGEHLVQAAEATRAMDLSGDPLVVHVAAEALTTAWPPEDPANHDDALTRSLRQNAILLRDLAGETLWTPDCHLLLLRLGESLGAAGLARAAAVHFGQLARLSLRHLGAGHDRTVTSMTREAHWRGESGDVAGALDGFARLLTDRLRTFGADHPSTLDAWSRLAEWQGRSGDAREAAEQYAVIAGQCARIHGVDHPETLRAGQGLARWAGTARGPWAAERVLASLVSTATRALGPLHSHTLDIRHDLANWHGRSGHASSAARSLRVLLDARVRELGPQNPVVLLTRHDLLNWRAAAGEEVKDEYERLVFDARYLLGPGHPQTLAAREALEFWGERSS